MDLIFGNSMFGTVRAFQKIDNIDFDWRYSKSAFHDKFLSYDCGIFITVVVNCENPNQVKVYSSCDEVSFKLSSGETVKQLLVSPYQSQIFILSDRKKCYVWREPSIPITCMTDENGQELKLEKIAIGSKIAVILTEDNNLHTVNVKDKEMINKPAMTIPYKTRIQSISCGNEHCILLCDTGQILTFGSGSKGQLGHGSTASEEQPRLVDALDGIIILSIASGGWHSAAISDSNDLYLWGWNKFGQLGFEEDITTLFMPQLVSFECENKFISDNFVSVSCGTCHTVVLTSEGNIYGWGWNAYQQLGLKSLNNVHKPVKIPLLENLGTPTSIQARNWTTIVTFNRLKKN